MIQIQEFLNGQSRVVFKASPAALVEVCSLLSASVLVIIMILDSCDIV